MYSSYHKIIKCVDFKSIHYVINVDIAPSSKVFSKFDYMFISNVS